MQIRKNDIFNKANQDSRYKKTAGPLRILENEKRRSVATGVITKTVKQTVNKFKS